MCVIVINGFSLFNLCTMKWDSFSLVGKTVEFSYMHQKFTAQLGP